MNTTSEGVQFFELDKGRSSNKWNTCPDIVKKHDVHYC